MKNFKYLENDNDEWMLAEDIPDIDLFFLQMPFRCFVSNIKKSIGTQYKKILAVYRGLNTRFYYGKEDCFRVGDHIVELLKKDPKFGHSINANIVKYADKLHEFVVKLESTPNVQALTNQQLWSLLEEHDKIHTEAYEWFWLPPASDNFHNNFTKYLTHYLKAKVQDQKKVNECFIALTNPCKKSLISIELEDFLLLAENINNDPFHQDLFLTEDIVAIKARMKPDIKRAILTHYYKYHHVKFNFLGTQGVYTFDDYVTNLSNLFKTKINIKAKLAEEKKRPAMEKEERERVFKELNIEYHMQQLFIVFGEFMLTKVYRRDAQIKLLYTFEKFLKEIARRLNLSLAQVRLMLTSELKDMLINGKIPSNLTYREKLCVYYAENIKDNQFIETIFTNEEGRKIVALIKEDVPVDAEELEGQCACPGTARGPVKIINNPAEISKMNKGDILVSIATNPDLVPAMEKAAAIITDYGGVTSHAAIVSRELGIPCIVGLSIATKVFKDGDLVEVDATKAIVKRLK